MKLTLRQMEYIVAIAETGQFALAARRLNVSQPSLSAQVADLEQACGGKLFLRGRSGATLTPLGQDAVLRIRKILREVDDLKHTLRGGGMNGQIKLGVLPSIGPYLLPPVVHNLHRHFPDVRLVVRELNTVDLEKHLRSVQLDMIISTPEDHPGTFQIPLFREKLWAAVAKDDPLAQSAYPVPLSVLAGRMFLTLEKGHRLSAIVHGLADKAQAFVSEEYQGTSLDAVRLMAATGAGVAILPDVYARTEARRGSDVHLLPIQDPAAQRDICLALSRAPDRADQINDLASLIIQAHANITQIRV